MCAKRSGNRALPSVSLLQLPPPRTPANFSPVTDCAQIACLDAISQRARRSANFRNGESEYKAIRNYDKRGNYDLGLEVSARLEIGKLWLWDWDQRGQRSFLRASFAARTRASGRETERERERGSARSRALLRVLYIHTIRTSSIPWYNGSLDYRPWIDLEAVETILDGISKSREIMDSVIRVIVILVFMILLSIYKF